MEIKEFKVRMNTATLIFLIAYALYTLFTIFTQDTSTIITIIVFGVICYAFFLGCRPYKYSIEKRTLTIHYRLWKNSHVDLMECETICDPVPRMADLVTRPHAIEIYTNTKNKNIFYFLLINFSNLTNTRVSLLKNKKHYYLQ